MSEEDGVAHGGSMRGARLSIAPIGPHDLWLAATCIAHGLTMVTGNVRESARVPGLERGLVAQAGHAAVLPDEVGLHRLHDQAVDPAWLSTSRSHQLLGELGQRVAVRADAPWACSTLDGKPALLMRGALERRATIDAAP